MKTARIAIIALCLLMLVLPCLAMPFFRSEGIGAENRDLADYPALLDSEEGLNPDFDNEFEEWLCDHFGFRTQSVRAYALMDYRLLHTSANNRVIAGKGDWLYLANTVQDFTGEGHLSESELENIAGNVGLLAEALSRQGARLYIAIVPNKSTVYPQFMPDRYAMREDEGNIALLREACEALPVEWIDLVSPLREAAEGDDFIYYLTDTHWNGLGAAIAAQAALRAMGRDAGGYSVQGEMDFSGGDLARLMGAPGDITERAPNVLPDNPLPQADFSEHQLTQSGEGEGRLLVYRDSFGTAIGPWLARAYGETELLWRTPLDATRPCDDALLLLCERNLREYLTEPPALDGEEDGDEPESGDEDADPNDSESLPEEDDFPKDGIEEDNWDEMDEDDPFFDDEPDDGGSVSEEDDFSDDIEEGNWEEMDEDDPFFDDEPDDGDSISEEDDFSDDIEEGNWEEMGEDDPFFVDEAEVPEEKGGGR